MVEEVLAVTIYSDIYCIMNFILSVVLSFPFSLMFDVLEDGESADCETHINTPRLVK